MRSLRGGCVHEGKRVTEKRQRNRQRKTRVKDWRSRRDPSPSLPPPSLSRMDMGVFGSFPHAPRTNTKRFTQPDVTSWLLQHKRARTPTRAQTHTHTHTYETDDKEEASSKGCVAQGSVVSPRQQRQQEAPTKQNTTKGKERLKLQRPAQTVVYGHKRNELKKRETCTDTHRQAKNGTLLMLLPAWQTCPSCSAGSCECVGSHLPREEQSRPDKRERVCVCV